MQNKKKGRKPNRKKVSAKIYKQSYMYTFTTTKATTTTKSKNKNQSSFSKGDLPENQAGLWISPQLTCVTHHTLLWETLLSMLLVEANRFVCAT